MEWQTRAVTGVQNCEMTIAEPMRMAPRFRYNLVLRFTVALTASGRAVALWATGRRMRRTCWLPRALRARASWRRWFSGTFRLAGLMCAWLAHVWIVGFALFTTL